MQTGRPDTKRAGPRAQVRRWQSEEVSAIELQRHEPKVDPNSAERGACRGSPKSPVEGGTIVVSSSFVW